MRPLPSVKDGGWSTLQKASQRLLRVPYTRALFRKTVRRFLRAAGGCTASPAAPGCGSHWGLLLQWMSAGTFFNFLRGKRRRSSKKFEVKNRSS
jgi:hypothetical protein